MWNKFENAEFRTFGTSLYTLDQQRAQKQVSTYYGYQKPRVWATIYRSRNHANELFATRAQKNHGILELVKICINTFPHFNAFEVYKMQVLSMIHATHR